MRSIRRASSALLLLFLVFLVLLLTHIFLATLIRVDGASMESTIAREAVVVVRREPKSRFARGAIVGLHLPTGKLVKRIIGLPGESVAIKDGEVTIGGLVAREPYTSGPTEGEVELRLSRDEYMVLGDNRGDSVDSRAFGPVRSREIIGRIRAILWPEFRVF